MPSHVVAVDLFALVLALAGFHLAFRQGSVRRGWRRVRPRDPARPPRPPRAAGEDEDPAHYAMMITGVMLMAFGLILGAFTTAYWLMSRSFA